mmetsp:Transcript_58542/g.126685  ORF Transcript_58542/g.126685 Transcript_58542/m.126685 type:complete len:245 (+) Transcript_58542:1128-1862(+)
MPTPTSALWIILQSLAPSPIARVIAFFSCLMRRTTAPFCLGDTRQQTTLPHLVEMATKSFSCSGASATWRHFPSMTRPSNITPFFSKSSAFCATFWKASTSLASSKSPSLASNSSEVKMGRSPFKDLVASVSGKRRPVATPMLMAVSTLSPVSIQTLIPAAHIFSMVSPTPSCNLSSIPVMPCNKRSTSISSATASSFSVRFSVAQEASLYLWNQVTNSSCEISRPARHKVRRPSSAISLRTSQ